MIDHAKFFAALAHAPFRLDIPARQQHAAVLLDAAEKRNPAIDPRWIAYMLATALWETGFTLAPIAEYGHGRGHAYGVPAGPWHQAYYGRGDVQLTWEGNYRHATARLRAAGVIGPDINLERNPDFALRPDIAAAVMVLGMTEGWFTGRKLADYFSDRFDDPVHARRIINGLDRAETIAGFYREFLHALLCAGPAVAA